MEPIKSHVFPLKDILETNICFGCLFMALGYLLLLRGRDSAMVVGYCWFCYGGGSGYLLQIIWVILSCLGFKTMYICSVRCPKVKFWYLIALYWTNSYEMSILNYICKLMPLNLRFFWSCLLILVIYVFPHPIKLLELGERNSDSSQSDKDYTLILTLKRNRN